MQRIGFVIHPEYSGMGFAVASVFEVANLVSPEPVYEMHYISEAGGNVRTSAGLVLRTTRFDASRFDSLVVCGATGVYRSSPRLLKFMKSAPKRCRRIAATCTGTFILAEAGLLDGKRATTHWMYARELETRFPKVKIDIDRIFIRDGNIWTSAGMSAGIDLGLALVEADFGPDVARAAARKLVLYHRRAGGQSQFSTLLELDPKSDRIQTALDFARSNLHLPLTVEQLAHVANLSPRQFSRAFRAETGQSPAKAVERLRVEAARLMLEQGRHSMETISRQTGFDDPNRMRRAFLRAFGQPPQTIRRSTHPGSASI
jgi:transcriptional regulator GlxA family with amidase domain